MQPHMDFHHSMAPTIFIYEPQCWRLHFHQFLHTLSVYNSIKHFISKSFSKCSCYGLLQFAQSHGYFLVKICAIFVCSELETKNNFKISVQFDVTPCMQAMLLPSLTDLAWIVSDLVDSDKYRLCQRGFK